MPNVDSYIELKRNPKIPAFRSGDTVRVHAKVIEGDRERIQAFEGVVIRIRKGGPNSNFTVRRISHGIGVERIFPYYSPLIDKVDVVRVGRVRRAKLYYLRDRVGKAARIKPGSRARFEALQAAMGAAPLEEDEIEEEILAEDELAEEPAEGEESPETEVEAEAIQDQAAAGEEPADVEAVEEAAAESEPSEEPEPEASAEPEADAEPQAPAEEQAEGPAPEDPAEEPLVEEPAEPEPEASAEEPEAEPEPPTEEGTRA